MSETIYYAGGRKLKERGSLSLDSAAASRLTAGQLAQMGIAADSALVGPAQAGGAVQMQFLQSMLPGVIRMMTAVRLIDEIAGIRTVGRWEDERIGLRVATPIGKAELYGDITNIPLASYGTALEYRHIVRFEQGFQVGKLEDARQSLEGFNAAEEKRRSATESLDMARNRLGFLGFNGGANLTFGLLNDPSLPAYQTATAAWPGATWAQVIGDLQRMISALETQSAGNFQDDMRVTLVLPLGYRAVMNKVNPVSAVGETVRDWLVAQMPNIRIIFAPEFLGANAAANVAYMFIENMGDGDDAGGATISQLVPERYRVLGSENRIKGYIEDATNAVAGIIIERPWAFTRMTGI